MTGLPFFLKVKPLLAKLPSSTAERRERGGEGGGKYTDFVLSRDNVHLGPVYYRAENCGRGGKGENKTRF